MVTNFAFGTIDLTGTFIRHTGPAVTSITGRAIDVLQAFNRHTCFIQTNCNTLTVAVLGAFRLLVEYTNILDANLTGRAIAVYYAFRGLNLALAVNTGFV